jgi:hypothetical protein
MGFTQIHTDLMYSALDHFLGTDTPVRIFRDEMGISFETALGNYGLVIPNEGGNWDVFLNEEKIYEIENEVYSIITHEGNAPSIDEYMSKLKDLSFISLKEESKKFVKMTKSGIEFLAVQGKIDLKQSFTYGPFMVFRDSSGKKRSIILN